MVWRGLPVDDASPNVFGIAAVRAASLASNAEMIAGVVTDKAGTPAGRAAAEMSVDVRRYGIVDTTGVADSSAAVIAALAAMATTGGELVFPAGIIKIASKITLPNTPHPGVGSEAPTQPTFRWRGQGGYASGQNGLGDGGTTLLLTYDGNGSPGDAKIVTYGLGQFVLTDLVLKDTTANADTPFIYTTNTTLKVARCAFIGATGGTSCAQDAIILGGTLKPLATGYGDPNSAFQGYGTSIRECYFNRIRRGVWGRSYCNQVQVAFNMFDKGCGTNLAGGACVEFNGSLNLADEGDYCTNNVVLGNYFHFVGGYYYQVKLVKATRCVVAFNGFVDAGANGVAGVRCEGYDTTTDYPSFDNLVIGNAATNVTTHLSEDSLSSGRNMLIGYGVGENSNLGERLRMALDAQIIVDTPASGHAWRVTDGITDFLRLSTGAGGTWLMKGALTLLGNAAGAGSTVLTVGGGSGGTDTDAIINVSAPTGRQNQIQFKRNGVNSWLFYDANSTSWFLRDSVNGIMHVTLVPGSASTGRVDLGVKLRVPATAGVEQGSGGPIWRAGTGSPEGIVTAPVGSLWSRTDGGAATTLYVKETGAGNTGWVAK